MRLALSSLCLGLLVSAAVASGSASAGPALDDGKAKAPAPTTDDHPLGTTEPDDPGKFGDGIEYGLGVRLRSVWVPKAILELFLDRAAGGAQNFGFGLDLTRRRGTTELQLGMEWERVTVTEGVWINKGDNVATGAEADYVLSPKQSLNHLSWFTVEFSFLNHAELTSMLSLRYGAGIGVGIILGELDHNNIVCAPGATNGSPEPGCVPMRFGGQGTYSEGQETQVAYDLPPVFPVVNAILGLQFKPSDNMTINLEGGIRTLPFVGISSSVFF
jgi:hypothetical protein